MFLNNKYTNWYNNIITKAVCQERNKKENIYYENHHIIPKSLGGNNEKNNLILLLPKEHYICHMLLCKMLENKKLKQKMICAFYMMHKSSDKKNTNSKMYSLLKIEYGKYQKERLTNIKLSESTKIKIKNNHADCTGANNSMFGVKRTEEWRKNHSIYMKNNNPRKGKTYKHTDSTKKILSDHGKIKWDNGSREKMKKTLSKGTYIVPWGEFISITDAINHSESLFKDKGTLRNKCKKNKNGYYFLQNLSNPSEV